MKKKIFVIFCCILILVISVIPAAAADIPETEQGRWFTYADTTDSPDFDADLLPRFWENLGNNPYFDTNEGLTCSDTMLEFDDFDANSGKVYDFSPIWYYVSRDMTLLTSDGGLVCSTVADLEQPCYVTGDWTKGDYAGFITKRLNIRFDWIGDFTPASVNYLVVYIGYFEPNPDIDTNAYYWWQGYCLKFEWTYEELYQFQFVDYYLLSPYTNANGEISWTKTYSGNTLKDLTIFLWQNPEDGYVWADANDETDLALRGPSTISELDFVTTRHPYTYYTAYAYGWNDGYNTGGDVKSYNTGYNDGYTAGEKSGEAKGFNEWNDSTEALFDGIGTLFDAPVRFFATIFDVTMFGVNLFSLLKFIVTLVIIIWVFGTIIKAVFL